MQKTIFFRVLRFYLDGFLKMPKWGRYLWLIILLKLFFMFAILKVFLMPDFLKMNFGTDKERGDYVLEQLTE
ncbi:MAG: DUF4492 domain-containing protein [Bacteroidota bacterium]|nr:DUF4492 domain-containing protein [Bacteroidota bacterium]